MLLKNKQTAEGMRKRIIEKLKVVEKGFSPLLDIKKLKGYKNHYRLRVGDFRILFFLEIILF
jgi:mRNA interferase RelE/StbE